MERAPLVYDALMGMFSPKLKLTDRNLSTRLFQSEFKKCSCLSCTSGSTRSEFARLLGAFFEACSHFSFLDVALFP